VVQWGPASCLRGGGVGQWAALGGGAARPAELQGPGPAGVGGVSPPVNHQALRAPCAIERQRTRPPHFLEPQEVDVKPPARLNAGARDGNMVQCAQHLPKLARGRAAAVLRLLHCLERSRTGAYVPSSAPGLSTTRLTGCVLWADCDAIACVGSQ